MSNVLPKTYEGTTTLIVGQSLSAVNPDYNALLASQRLSQTYADVATTGTDPGQGHLEALGTTPDELLKRLSADALRDSTLIKIVARDSDPNRAAAIANAVADELIAASPAIQGRAQDAQNFIDAELRSIQSQIESSQAEVSRLSGLPARSASQEQDLQTAQNRLVTLRSTYATLLASSSNSSSNLLSVVEPAKAPLQPASPRPLLNTVLAAILGLLVALGIAFLIEYLDDTVKSAEDVEAAVALPALGGIGRMKTDKKQRSEIYHLVTLLYPRSSIAEAYRTLRTNTEFAMVDAPAGTLLVTSTVPGEGKTTTAGNLAVAFAQAGRRTLLVDADLRKPGIHRMFDLPNAYGLSTLFRSEEASLEQLVNTTEQEGLSVMTSGPLPPNPAELLGSKRFTAILHRLRDAYDLVVIDSPPLQAVTDAAILASVTDGTLFVIDAGRTRRGAAMQGREALAKAGAHVLGAVMNRLSSRVRGEYYYNAYGAYGQEQGGGKPAAAKQRSTVPLAEERP